MKKYPAALWTLFIGAFSIGMTEFIIMGLLPDVAADVHSSISTAGQLITGYALGVAVGGPILILITCRMAKKNLLILLMCLFCIGNIFAAFAQNYGLLLLARLITSLAHGTFFGVGVTIGNIIGGKLADWNINRGLLGSMILFLLFFIILHFIEFSKTLMIPGVFIFGILAFSLVPMLQFRILELSSDAPTLASTLNQSAMNLGNAGGAFIGGLSIAYLPMKDLTLVAPLVTLIGLLLFILQLKLSKYEVKNEDNSMTI